MSNISPQWTAALASQGITTAYLIRLEFSTETVLVWTGAYALTPVGQGDVKLDGFTFAPLVDGALYDVGENAYSMSGSGPLDLTISTPESLPDVLAQSQINENVYLARPAYMWRAVMISQAGLSTPAVWLFKRVRTGAIDKLSFVADADTSVCKITIGSHATYISNATNSSWADQRRLDPDDSSQDYMYSVTDTQPISNSKAYGASVYDPHDDSGQYGRDYE
jgi:hypothetical protein